MSDKVPILVFVGKQARQQTPQGQLSHISTTLSFPFTAFLTARYDVRRNLGRSTILLTSITSISIDRHFHQYIIRGKAAGGLKNAISTHTHKSLRKSLSQSLAASDKVFLYLATKYYEYFKRMLTANACR